VRHRECFGRGVGRAKHGAGREKMRAIHPCHFPTQAPLLWGHLRPRERRFDRPYVFHMLLCDYVFGAFLPSLPGCVRNAHPLIKTAPVDVRSSIDVGSHKQGNQLLFALTVCGGGLSVCVGGGGYAGVRAPPKRTAVHITVQYVHTTVSRVTWSVGA
jgi:hypothetical protein